MTESSTGSGSSKRRLRPRIIGIVTGDRVSKTRKVVFEYLSRHSKYNKYVKRQTVLHVHDENNESRVGDHVEVMACRPFSKTKTYRLVRIVTRAAQIDTSILSGEASQMFEKPKADKASEQPSQETAGA
ncbi:MAG: 30S ribosomal protein S17 [Phycisphaerae bacterium]